MTWYLALLLGACGDPGPADSDLPIDQEPRCDGELQAGEEGIIDSPFDLDGDTFPDQAVTECASVYGVLDCDDTNPAVHPSAVEVQCNGVDDDCSAGTKDAPDLDEDGVDICDDCDDTDERRFPGNPEVCFDGIDQDCSGFADEDCGPNYNGDFVLDLPIQYVCALGSVTIDFGMVSVYYDPPQIDVTSIGGSQPGRMTGSFEEGAFEVTAQVQLGTNFACDEHYRLTGTFTDVDHFEGTFEAAYTSNVGWACGNCLEHQSWPIAASRY